MVEFSYKLLNLPIYETRRIYMTEKIFSGGGTAITQENMKNLSDDLLIETYYKAIELKLSKDFIMLVREEIEKRSLLKKVKKTS